MLYNNSLPYNRSVTIHYKDGVITSNDICEAMIMSCRSFGQVALIESEMNYIEFQSSDLIKLTYNRILQEETTTLGIESPIKAIIVKDYESSKETYGLQIEDKIKAYVQNVNYYSLLGRGEYFETRNLFPCFFLVN
jgi:hypothetical protein